MTRYSYRHLAFTGSKDTITPAQVKQLENELRNKRDRGYLWMHNGDCVVSDHAAAMLWKKLNGRVMLHPPIKNRYRADFHQADIICEPADYLTRDRHMVDCSELIIGTPQTYEEQTRSGTWATLRYAKALRLERIIIFPDGSVDRC
jgi:hypothetical protein